MSDTRPTREDFGHLPRAVAIIMDGNGRWAEAQGLPTLRGHERGAESVRAVTREAARLGIEELTLYAFSTENWRRSQDEVTGLMELLRRYLVEEREEIMSNAIRFRAIGELERLPDEIQAEFRTTRELSADNTGMVLRLALSYGGRRELLRAAQSVARLALAEGIERVLDLEEDDLRRFLYDPEMIDPDLLVRTAGEMRVSNFLLWQISYAEFVASDVLWPDFREEALHATLRAYAARERRFGAR